MDDGYRLDRPQTLSCPECGGTLSEQDVGGMLQYRCHIGHVLSAEAMLDAQFAMLELRLGSCMALLNERAELCRQMGEAAQSEARNSEMFEQARQESLARADVLRRLLESEWVQPAA
jgi:two-component system chemotaxis response regulator CheB